MSSSAESTIEVENAVISVLVFGEEGGGISDFVWGAEALEGDEVL